VHDVSSPKTTTDSRDEAPVTGDFVRPFLLEVPGLLGRLVRLGPVVDTVLTRHDYPEPVARLLGEFLALAGTLSSLLKYEGTFTLQTKGDGPVRLMVADVTSDGELRGYAEVDPAGLETARAAKGGGGAPEVARWLGSGYMAFTVDLAPDGERYQGIVELSGDSLADCVNHYFRQSEQLKTAFKLTARRGAGEWRAGGLFLQQMPESGGTWTPGLPDEPEEIVLGSGEEDDWRRALAFMASCSGEELLSETLPADDLLYRLFHEERVRVYRVRPLSLGCRCSRARLETVLRSLPPDEVREMTVDGEVVMTCQFCNVDFRFDDAALDDIYAS
jgi:molecular chaperone Hsp33